MHSPPQQPRQQQQQQHQVPVPRLYQVMGLDQQATSQQIKRRYHELALKYHPDKNPEGGEIFKDIAAAYDVLSDPKKRQVYDKYGDRGLEALENPYASPLMNSLGMSVLLVVLSIMALVTVTCCIIVAACVAAKVDGKVSWSWGVTFWGAWIFDAAVGLLTLFYYVSIVRSLVEEGEESQVHVGHFLAGILPILWIAFNAMASTNLDNHWTSQWSIPFVPYIIIEFVLFIQAIPTIPPRKIKDSIKANTNVEPATWVWILAWINHMVHIFLRPLTLLLLLLQIGLFENTTWLVVAIPFFISVPTGLLHTFGNTMHLVACGQTNCLGVLMALGFQMFHLGLLVAGIVLTCLFIDGSASFSLGVALIPIYIWLCFAWFGAGGLLIFSLAQTDQTLQDMEEMQEAQNAQQDG